MATNNNKFNYFGIVINAPKEKATDREINDFFNATLTALKEYNKVKFFASAIHDKDKHEDGTSKTIHQHIQIETYEKYTNLTFLKDFCAVCGINKDLVSLNGSNNLFLLVQYLTHKNQPTKTQYDYSIIKTNSAELCDNLYNTDYESREDLIMRALRKEQTIDGLMQAIGIVDANKYKGLFKDLKIEQKQNYESIVLDLEKTKHEYDQLWRFVNNLLITLKMSLKDTEKRMLNLDRYERTFLDTFNSNE